MRVIFLTEKVGVLISYAVPQVEKWGDASPSSPKDRRPCMCVCVCVCGGVRACVCACVRACVRVCVYVRMYICMYVCM